MRRGSVGTRAPAKDTGAFDERQLGEVGQQERSEKGVEGERGGEREGGREGGRESSERACASANASSGSGTVSGRFCAGQAVALSLRC